MPRINLLPVKAARRQVSARNEMVAMLSLVGVTLASLMVWYGNVDGEVAAQEAKLSTLDQDIGKLSDEVKKVEELQAKEKKVGKKLEIIKQLYAGKTGPARMLDELATIMTSESKRVWLTRLEQKETGELILQGGAMDHEDISEFQLALERRETFTKVKLRKVSTNKPKKDEAEYLSWELACVTRFKAG